MRLEREKIDAADQAAVEPDGHRQPPSVARLARWQGPLGGIGLEIGVNEVFPWRRQEVPPIFWHRHRDRERRFIASDGVHDDVLAIVGDERERHHVVRDHLACDGRHLLEHLADVQDASQGRQ